MSRYMYEFEKSNEIVKGDFQDKVNAGIEVMNNRVQEWNEGVEGGSASMDEWLTNDSLVRLETYTHKDEASQLRNSLALKRDNKSGDMYLSVCADLYGENEYTQLWEQELFSADLKDTNWAQINIYDELNKGMDRSHCAYKMLMEQEKEMNTTVIESEFDDSGKLHALFQRGFDESYVVWSSLPSDKEGESYSSMYNGAYDLDLEKGLDTLSLRSGLRDVEIEIEYLGEDSQGRYVFKSKEDNIYKAYWNEEDDPSLITASDLYTSDRYDGEPDSPLRDNINISVVMPEKIKAKDIGMEM